MLLAGLMSGTSTDGIDAALVECSGGEARFRWKLLAFQSTPYDEEFRSRLLDAATGKPSSTQELCLLDAVLGEKLGEAARKLIADSGLDPKEIAAVASHGHTLWHQPEAAGCAGIFARGTLQIGKAAAIAERTGCRVISDFRAADMAAGGQGAPLVPMADWLLFRSHKENRVVLNLGGIANITCIPAGARRDHIAAFDTGPANMVIDEACALLSGGRRRYDADGRLAATGRSDEKCLSELLGDPWFAAPPPKSTGRERFGRSYAEKLARRVRKNGGSEADILATATALAARSAGQAIRRFFREGVVITGGGGVWNGTLMAMLRDEVAPLRLAKHEDYGIPSDAKEAIAFAILGYRTLLGRPGNVPSATGARREVVLGSQTSPLPRFPR